LPRAARRHSAVATVRSIYEMASSKVGVVAALTRGWAADTAATTAAKIGMPTVMVAGSGPHSAKGLIEFQGIAVTGPAGSLANLVIDRRNRHGQ